MAFFRTVKLPTAFVRWAKVEAAKADVPLYEYIERMCAQGHGTAPWGLSSLTRRTRRRGGGAKSLRRKR